MKNKYNPLKMKGPRIGAALACILTVAYTISRLSQWNTLAAIFVTPLLPQSPLYNLLVRLNIPIISSILAFLSVALYGFLVGWIINSLIIKFRKKRRK